MELSVKVEDLLDGDDWQAIEERIVDTSRWRTVVSTIYLHKPTNKFYKWVRQDASTEYQDNDWSYKDSVEVTEVEPVEKTVTVYQELKEENK